MDYVTDDEPEEEEEEEDASIMGASFSRPTGERTSHNNIDRDTDQPKCNPVRE
jgi:hypothetical protein